MLNFTRSVAVLMAAILVLGTFLGGCSEDRLLQEEVRSELAGGDAFALHAKYSRIRSCPEGGGLFILVLTPGPNLDGDVELSVESAPCLHAELDRNTLNWKSRVAEVSIRPDATAEFRDYEIKVEAGDGNTIRTLSLQVEMLQWSAGVSDFAETRLDEFVDWFRERDLEFGNLATKKWFTYLTYPRILVVEHWTFVSRDWEVRLCYHVMVPPYDWSMIRLRRRGEVEPVFAARRDSDGTIYQIPISEYPLMFGY
jgi:hypothetical protein